MTATTDDRVTPAPAPQGGSMTELVSGILTDAQKLLKQQVDMLRAEIREDFRKTKDVAVYLGVGIGLAAVGGAMLLVALVYLIEYLTNWHPAACWGLVGGLTAAAGAITFVVGRRIITSFNPLPDKSLNALTENVSWIANTQPQT